MQVSSTITELAKALTKAQAMMKPVKATNENPYFKSKYADLAAVWESCRKPLTDNGLSVVQTTECVDGKVIIETVLLHESGEWISSQISLTPAKNDPQSIGSAITYGRRYSLSAMVGVCAEDEDDDAQKASDPAKQQNEVQVKQQKQANGQDKATEAQLKKIFVLAKELSIAKELMTELIGERYGKEHSKDLTKREASDLIEYLESTTTSKQSEEERP